VARRDRSRGG